LDRSTDGVVSSCILKTTPVYTFNELIIAAPIDTVWAWLIRAPLWSSFYSNCSALQIIEGTSQEVLALGTKFTWTTSHIAVTTVVTEFEEKKKLSWRGEAMVGEGYHSWFLEEIDSNQCHVITEEVQKGMLPFVGQYFLNKSLHENHQKWLEGLAMMSKRGPP